MAGGAPGCNEELVLLNVLGSDESLLIPEDASRDVRDLSFPNSRRILLVPLMLDVCDDDESTRRKSDGGGEKAERL